MADDWEDDPTNFDISNNAPLFLQGRNYSKGRGFTPALKIVDDDWDDNVNATQSSVISTTDGYGNGGRGGSADDFNDNWNDNENHGGRRDGRGRGGGRPPQNCEYDGGGGNCDRNQSGDEEDCGGRDNGSGERKPRWNRENGGSWNGDRKPRRNREHGNGDWGGNGGDNYGEPKEERKRMVTYIPEESTDDQIYESGLAVGQAFNDWDMMEVRVTGNNPVPCIANFRDMSLRKVLLENIDKSHYTRVTPIQKHAIPNINAGRDLMGCAQTGSGKTAAFLIPIMQQLLEKPAENVLTEYGCQPQVIIMVPTRELAIQICDEARKFAMNTVIKCAAIYGGVQAIYQGDKLRSGIEIITATPGRLNDFVNHRRVNFCSIRFIVLDEADRMLDQGFLPDMEKILNHESMVPVGQRQTLMFSATFSPQVQELCAKYMNDYLFLTVGTLGSASKDVEQVLLEVERKKKKSLLLEILDEYRDRLQPNSDDQLKIIVFVETKKNTDYIAAYLCESDFPATSIHGDRLQMEREKALKDFRCGRRPILVATSVGARGLDMKVSHVINYDLPKSVDEYIHRIGRTGRLGNKGKATSFYDDRMDSALKGPLVKILSDSEQPVPEFLGADGGQFTDASVGSNFGGYDIRNTCGGATAEPEEDW